MIVFGIRQKSLAIVVLIKYKISFMEINDKLLKKLSQLSALHLSDQEKSEIKEYLKETLSHFEKIKAINTKNVRPLVSPLEPPLTTRLDQTMEYLDKDDFLEQAPQKLGSLVKVPPTV